MLLHRIEIIHLNQDKVAIKHWPHSYLLHHKTLASLVGPLRVCTVVGCVYDLSIGIHTCSSADAPSLEHVNFGIADSFGILFLYCSISYQ